MKTFKKLFAVPLLLLMALIMGFAVSACGEDNSVQVTFMLDNAVYGIISVKDGTEKLPDDPVKELYTFDGWFKDKALSEKFDIEEFAKAKDRADTVVYAGFTFTGKTYTVTFNATAGSFGTENTSQITVREREKISESSVKVPEREDYAFVGWSENSKGTKMWNFNTDIVTGNITLYAVWSRVYTVTYDTHLFNFIDGGKTYSVKVNEGELAPLPQNIDIDYNTSSYRLDGYSLDPEAATGDWNFNEDVVAEDMTLYAIWYVQHEEYEVEYFPNYAGAQSVKRDTFRQKLDYVPEREGYIFDGWWYSDGEQDVYGNYILTERVDLSELITEDGTKVYAKWIDPEKTCSVLSTPSPSYVQSTKLITWQEVDGAVNYEITIKETGSQNNGRNEICEDTEYSLKGYNEGSYTYQVRAIGNGYNTVTSPWSTPKSVTVQYILPSPLSFDITTSVLSWEKVNYVRSYKLYVDGTLVKTYAETDDLQYDLSEYDAGEYTVKVDFISSGSNTESTSKTITKYRLKSPNATYVYNKSSSRYELRWDEVADASYYLVNIDGKEHKVNDTYYSVTSTDFGDKDEIVVKVDAFNEDAIYLISDSTPIRLGKFKEVTVNFEGAQDERVYVKNLLYSWYLIKFNSMGGTLNGSVVPDQIIRSDSSGLSYIIPTRSGYTFTGWYTDRACTKAYDFSKPPYRNITLYAGWYEVNYNNSTVIPYYDTSNSKASYTMSGSLSNTSSSSPLTRYYCSLTGGEYTIKMTSDKGSSNMAEIQIVNLITGEQIYKAGVYNTVAREKTFRLEAGDVIQINMYRTTSSGTAPNYTFELQGRSRPADGGRANSNLLSTGLTDAGWAMGYSAEDGEFKVATSIGTKLTFYINENVSENFAGWYVNGTLVSSELEFEYTVTTEDETVTAKWNAAQ